MTNTQIILEKLIAFKTTADRPEEIKKCCEYIASLFSEAKFDMKIYEKNSVYSLLVSFKGKDGLHSKILLNGHFDVVPAESEVQYQMRVEGNKAYGRGTVDMKGMVAVLVEVMRELKNSPDVALLLNGDEEIGGEDGAGFLVREKGLKPAFVVCGDGIQKKEGFTLVVKEKGVVWMELSAKGKSAHGAYPWLGENAIEKVIAAVEDIKRWIGPVKPEAWKTTANLSFMETSNKTPNKVPSDAHAVLDIRFTEDVAKTPQELEEKVKKLIPDVSVHFLASGALLSMEENHPFVLAFSQAAEEVVGEKVRFDFTHGATDVRYFAEVGIPAVIFGPVGGNMHAEGEWVDLQSLKENKEILLKFLSGQNL